MAAAPWMGGRGACVRLAGAAGRPPSRNVRQQRRRPHLARALQQVHPLLQAHTVLLLQAQRTVKRLHDVQRDKQLAPVAAERLALARTLQHQAGDPAP